MFHITGHEIAELSDTDLRVLIGLLCESELRASGIPTAGVTWGGNQDARDGGLDVRVDVTSPLHRDSYIPKSKTGFQVKKPDMPRAAISNEMRPHGQLRQVIKDLVDDEGAYVIVSSQGSTSDSALTNRKRAMQEALSDYPGAVGFKVDFYDRERIAGWVRSHPSLGLWVREKIGRSFQGWRAYGNWSKCPGGLEEEYMLDGHVRLYNSANARSNGLSAIDGINELRTILQRPGSSVRLVGLSGVGKTRLLQTLFDERIGERALNQSQVFYCDVSDSPSPTPRSFAENLVTRQQPAILAIDNCPPELHKQLTSLCTASGSVIRLITIEYDVRDDQPEETEVFRLEPASEELIRNIIHSRFDYISEVDARTIAEFSGGNARIAMALSNTIRRGENIAELRDYDLFNRLFQQRNEPNDSLRRATEVCSLVYSFDCQTEEGSDLELRLLGTLARMSVREIYEKVSELKRRDLVQQRNIWRAVLPHALANKLAQRALEDIPLNDILSVLENSQRLLKSFARRLGYLHENVKANEIAELWLSENGLLGDVSNLNELGISLLINIAPINPELTLSVIERVPNRDDAQRFFSRENNYYIQFTRLLRSLSYDKDLFERSVDLLCRFALSERPKENSNSIRDLLRSLFYIKLSGTQATPEQRLGIIRKLTATETDDQIDLAINLLGASLESWRFSSSYSYEFGSRSRDYGFSPRSEEDIKNWFKLFIRYTVDLVIKNSLISIKAKSILAEKFRGLWTKAGMYDELEFASMEILKKGSWTEGWVAVRSTKKFDGKDMNPEVISRLDKLEVALEPKTLIERAKLFSLTPHLTALDLVDVINEKGKKTSDEYAYIENITRSLGCEVAANEEILEKLLPEILSNDGVRLFSFGQGLAHGCKNPQMMWEDFREQLTMIEEPRRNYQAIRGFLNAVYQSNISLAEAFLNKAVTDEVFATVYPWLQTSIEITKVGVDRLKGALEMGIAPIQQYGSLAYGRASETIDDDSFCELLKMIASKPEGIEVAVHILHMRIIGHSKDAFLSDPIISLGQELIMQYEFSRKRDTQRDRMDYDLADIIRTCFVNESAEENARVLSSRLMVGMVNYDIYSMDFALVLETLITVKPVAFLDMYLQESLKSEFRLKQVLLTDGTRRSLLTHIDDEVIIDWCEIDPVTRYPIVAALITPYQKTGHETSLEWTSLALKFIYHSPDPTLVLEEFKLVFRPMSWSGSRAEIMEKNLELILNLTEHENSVISDWARREEEIFRGEIRSEREWESKTESERNERFEY